MQICSLAVITHTRARRPFAFNSLRQSHAARRVVRRAVRYITLLICPSPSAFNAGNSAPAVLPVPVGA